jgi:hypothetical protein
VTTVTQNSRTHATLGLGRARILPARAFLGPGCLFSKIAAVLGLLHKSEKVRLVRYVWSIRALGYVPSECLSPNFGFGPRSDPALLDAFLRVSIFGASVTRNVSED